MVNKALTVKGEKAGGGLNVPGAAIDMFKLICISTFKFQLPAGISCLERLIQRGSWHFGLESWP